MNIFSTQKAEKVRKAFFSGFLILSLVLSQAALPLSIAYATDGEDQQTLTTTDQSTDIQQQDDQQTTKKTDDENHKVNICHATESQNNPWNAISIDESALQTHLGHGDFAYAGPTDDGKPKHGDEWCGDHAPKPTPTATIEATKIVCDTEADLPNWGARDTVTSITANTANTFLMAHSGCKEVPWTFEWAASSATNPGDNVQTGGAGWTAFTSTATVPVGSTLWVREQTQSGYVPFSGATSDKVVLTSPEAQNSAEMYCDTDVYNYDNFDRTDTVNANETHHCIAFNAKIPQQQLSCNPEVNLIQNGDFEAPALSTNSWDVIPASNPLLKWLVDWVNTPVNASARLGLEIQNHVAGSPFAGAQHAELDGDAPVTISQNIATIPGKQYSLTFQYSPRPGVANNALQPKVAGAALGAVVNADGSANADTVWQPITRTFVATSALTKVEIADVGAEDSLGGYIDNVSLTCTGDPAPQCKEAATSSLVSDGTTMVDGHGAVPVTTPVHSAWTASIPGATWIWSEADVLDATVDTTKTFTKTFTVVGTPLDSTLTLAADNNYDVYVNGVADLAPGCSDSTGATFASVQTCAIPAEMLLIGTNTTSIVVKNWAVSGSDAKSNPAGLLYKLTLNNNECVTPEPKSGAVHIFKFVNGVQATVENTQGVSFPMFTATYNAPFTLSPTGWGPSDIAYEASTGTLNAGATYTANENLSGSLVGASCEVGNPSYELVGYSTGNSLEAAKNAVKSTTAPVVSINGDKYIIVWNQKCGEVEGAHTLKVHLYKYLKDGNTESQIPNTSEVAPFPMTATWKTANLNGGVSSSSPYVLGNYHGQSDLKYAADTAPMQAPADYTSSEVTSTDSDFLPIGAQCVPGKYRLVGYRSSAVSLDNAKVMPLMSVAPEFINLNDDRWVIVVNEKCADLPPPPTMGTIEITKYTCPANFVPNRTNNGVGSEVPEGCTLTSGTAFGYVHGEQTDANGPYPELDAALTAGGSTGTNGKLVIGPVLSAGRYLIKETDATNLAGLYCEGDGDTNPNNNDNQELTFVPANGVAHCVAYNKAPVTPPTCPATYTDDSDNSGAIRFENSQGYSTGSVNGVNGWSATGAYDYGVVANTFGYPSFNDQAFRISDGITSGSFGDWAFATPNTNGAGEADSTAGTFSKGTLQNHFEAQFDIASTTPCTQQEGLHFSVSPDRGDGSRMSYLRFEDQADGLHVFFDDVSGTDNASISFDETDIATLSRSIPHKIKFVMDFVNGPSNDVVKVYIDGSLAHTGTSWENYYRYDNEASAEQSPRIVKTLIFQARGTAHPANMGKGFLVDNLTLGSSIPAPLCSDGIDNDGDQKTDFPADPGCSSATDNDESDGGGSGPILPPGGGGGSRMILGGSSNGGQVLGASTQCGLYLDDFLKMGKKNNKDEVKKLQTFLNDYLKLKPKLAVNGIFGIQTYKAVLKFQEQESDYVIKPWVGVTLKDSKKGTGWVYKTTVTRINNIMCPELNLQNPPLTID